MCVVEMPYAITTYVMRKKYLKVERTVLDQNKYNSHLIKITEFKYLKQISAIIVILKSDGV